jgi:DNA-binding NtrC family response regulator
VADLRILALTDSFQSEWPTLARAHGLGLATVDDPGALEPSVSSITLIVAGGAESSIEAVLRRTPQGNRLVAAVGADPSHRLASAVVRGGADDYFALPADLDALRSWVADAAARIDAEREAAAFAERERGEVAFEGVLGTSAALHAALARARRVIDRPSVTVLLTGETGTGKELLARAIHYNGPRRDAPFVDVNCAAIPDNLLESELFGHEKGAFTGATGAKPGLMQLADGGTLFLDEIGHLPLPLQGKLLRALEERTIRRVGGTRTIPFDVRLIAATHVELAAAVRRGEFREDLFYRLNVLPIELPALRERVEDIVPLAEHFLARFKREYGVPSLALSATAKRTLGARAWPGNVSELRNTIERAVLLADGTTLEAEDVAEDAAPARTSHGDGDLPFPATIAAITQAAAQRMLALCRGNKSVAARRLGVSRPRLQRLLDATLDQLQHDDAETDE